MIQIEDIRDSVMKGRTKEVEQRIREALSEGMDPRSIVEEALIPGVRDVGLAQFETMDGGIPRILCAARGMRIGLDILEPYLSDGDSDGYTGTVILGTVQGDLHDVGKNLVAIMFRSVGFRVIDLGVDISNRRFIQAIKEHPEARLICLSSLLSTALPEMKRLVAVIRRADKDGRLRIMVGGGAVSKEFADDIGADAYTESAVEAAMLGKQILEELNG